MAEKPTYKELEQWVKELEQEKIKRKQAEQRQALNIRILDTINKSEVWKDCIEEILSEIKQFTGFEAVAIRLCEKEDFPYYVTKGFPPEFVEAERYLCTRDSKGEIIRDSEGNPYVECMCGNIVCGRTDPSKDFFTENGSFWSNNTSKLLSETTDEDRQARTRNRCNSEGYESVALFPLKAGNEILGLLQINDTRPHQFTDDIIQFFEEIGITVGTAFSRKQAEEELNKINEKLEETVKERTTELEEKNTTLKVLLEQRGGDQKKLEESIMSNVKELLLPNINRLKSGQLSSKQQTALNVLESNLNEIISPFANKASSNYMKLTPTEIQIANFIKYGSSSKEISGSLGLSQRTVDSHRYNIRKKFGVSVKGINLRTYLLSLP